MHKSEIIAMSDMDILKPTSNKKDVNVNGRINTKYGLIDIFILTIYKRLWSLQLTDAKMASSVYLLRNFL